MAKRNPYEDFRENMECLGDGLERVGRKLVRSQYEDVQEYATFQRKLDLKIRKLIKRLDKESFSQGAQRLDTLVVSPRSDRRKRRHA